MTVFPLLIISLAQVTLPRQMEHDMTLEFYSDWKLFMRSGTDALHSNGAPSVNDTRSHRAFEHKR